MVNETYVTIRGYAGGDPVVFVNDAGRASAFVRVGVTHRIYDRANKRYSDGVTVWYSVRTYGELANNVASSVTKGTPVLARGRLSQRVWTDSGGVEHAENCVFADSLGIELSTGMAQFSKVRSAAAKKMPTGDMSPEVVADVSSMAAHSAQYNPSLTSRDTLAQASLGSYQSQPSYSHVGSASYAPAGAGQVGQGESLEEGSETSAATSEFVDDEFAQAASQGSSLSKQLQEV